MTPIDPGAAGTAQLRFGATIWKGTDRSVVATNGSGFGKPVARSIRFPTSRWSGGDSLLSRG